MRSKGIQLVSKSIQIYSLSKKAKKKLRISIQA